MTYRGRGSIRVSMPMLNIFVDTQYRTYSSKFQILHSQFSQYLYSEAKFNFFVSPSI